MTKTRLLLASLVMTMGSALEARLKACVYNPNHTMTSVGSCQAEPGSTTGTLLCYTYGTSGDKCTGS